MSARTAPLPALVLGGAGLLPFVALALFAAFDSGAHHTLLLTALAEYAAIILSFVGALQWGYAVRRDARGVQAWLQYGWSVTPALIAWLSLQLPSRAGLQMQAAALCACFVVDNAMARVDRIPEWFNSLRGVLTVVAALSLLATSLWLPRDMRTGGILW